MTDVFTPAKRSDVMSKIRSSNTQPERLVRSILHRLGYRFRLHTKGIIGKPDVVLRRHKTVVFVHGCFWHRHARCKYAYKPKTRKAFWFQKFNDNVARDKLVRRRLARDGWRVITVWECETRDLDVLAARLGSIDPNCHREHVRPMRRSKARRSKLRTSVGSPLV